MSSVRGFKDKTELWKTCGYHVDNFFHETEGTAQKTKTREEGASSFFSSSFFLH